MSSAPKPPPATPRLAATVLLLRDGADGLEVFMVVRHHQIDFAAGALVFPGGKLAPGDSEAAVHARCSGIGEVSAEQRALRVAAIREAFEECGVLLARQRGAAALVGPQRLAALGARYRKPLETGEAGIGQMLEAEDLELACDALVPFAHWITPVNMPKRFDTHFYLAAAPADHLAVHDGTEHVDSVWLRPADAIAEGEAGTRTIIPPTRLNLQVLAQSRSVAQALTAARQRPIVTVLPVPFRGPEGVRMRIPAEAGYGITEFVPEAAASKL
ncbi:MAG: NUDIX hydrolase [Nevskia sp.]|nr:NUDIX hydrolase [Nevskia sp.]